MSQEQERAYAFPQSIYEVFAKAMEPGEAPLAMKAALDLYFEGVEPDPADFSEAGWAIVNAVLGRVRASRTAYINGRGGGRPKGGAARKPKPKPKGEPKGEPKAEPEPEPRPHGEGEGVSEQEGEEGRRYGVGEGRRPGREGQGGSFSAYRDAVAPAGAGRADGGGAR